MAIPDAALKLGVKKDFARILLTNIKRNLFHSIYLNLKKKTKEGAVNEDYLSKIMDDYIGYGMYDFFKVFDYQFTLSALRTSIDPKVITKRIEDLRQRIEFRGKLSERDSTQDYEKIFLMIDRELDRREKIGRRWSVRAACDYYAKNELGIGGDVGQQLDLDNFYQKYLAYKKNISRH